MISRYYKYGITFEQMAEVEIGDTIQLEQEGKVTVVDKVPPVHQGQLRKIVQRSAIVRTEENRQRLLVITEDSELPRLVTF